MNWRHIWAIFMARNYEFIRDRAAFGWNFAFPFLLIIGFGFIFGEQNFQRFNIGIFPAATEEEIQQSSLPESFLHEQAITLIPIANLQAGQHLLHLHKLDLLIDTRNTPHAYWINKTSPTGHISEQLYLLSFFSKRDEVAKRQVIQSPEIRYIDWFFPGLLGMNMMFSALWGVGYIVVRYRKNGTLKRLKATPLTPFEFLAAQMLSRIFLILSTLCIVWIGSDLIFHFHVAGSFFTLALVFLLGSISLTSIGLLLAARGTSEEFTSGVLNFISWPMMFLSEVWFSLSGAPPWLQSLSQIFPLKHLLVAARKVMGEGAGLADIQNECLFLIVFSIVTIGLAAWLFSWNE